MRFSMLLALTVFSSLAGLLVGSCAGTAAAAEQTMGLTLSVDFNKDTYVLGEPVIVRLSITNTGSAPITDRWFAYTRGFYLRLENGAGRQVYMDVEETEKEQIITDWVQTLCPRETVTTSFDLTRGDILGTSPFFPKLATCIVPPQWKVPGYVVEPGTYRLVVTHDLQMNKPEDGKPIRLTASKEFTVRAPSGVERRALLLFESQPSFEGDGAEDSQRQALADYERIWKAYRTTPYAPYALYYSARILQQQGNLDAAVAKYSLLAKEFPQFPLLADALYYQAAALHDSGQVERARGLARARLVQFRNRLVAPDVPTREKGSRVLLLLSKLGLQEGG